MASSTNADQPTVLVTGAGKGLGAAFATGCARAGRNVVVNNRHRGEEAPSAQRIANALIAEGLQASADLHAVDAPGAAEAIVQAAISTYGRLDALILNAGVNGAAAKIETMADEDLAQVMAINFFANAALVRAALPYLKLSDAGRILFVSSTAGLHGLRGRAHYAASKGAINAYAMSLADEQRRARIGVNVLMPYAATAMTEGVAAEVADKLGPERVAPLAVWLTSPQCAETGQFWVAGAGRFRRAYMVETRGAALEDPTPSALDLNADRIGDMAGARTYPGGEAAFADFFADATKS